MQRKRGERPSNNQIRFVPQSILHLLCPSRFDRQGPGAHKPVAGSTFEEVLYGNDSDSEVESDEEDNAKGHKKRTNVHGGVRLRVDNDQPMDLLESAVTKVTSESRPLFPDLPNTNTRRHSLQED